MGWSAQNHRGTQSQGPSRHPESPRPCGKGQGDWQRPFGQRGQGSLEQPSKRQGCSRVVGLHGQESLGDLQDHSCNHAAMASHGQRQDEGAHVQQT
eukprot:3737474-Heterocapsa_arctica.AAC.1